MRIDKSIFMLQKLLLDLRRKYQDIPVSEEPYGPELKSYYIAFDTDFKKLNRLIVAFDEEGIPMNKSYVDVEEPKIHYYPISIGQFGLALFHECIKTEEKESKDHFIRIADWFLANATVSDEMGAYWLTDIPKPEYGVEQPWKSAFSQSRALSILLRAWQMTGKQQYLTTASLALRPFAKDIGDGGVSVDRDKGQTFYEEYVAEVPTRVLDGHLFSLFGLYDYIRSVPKEINWEDYHLAVQLFEEGVEGLIKTIDHYDLGYWLLFNRCELKDYPTNDPCTIGYLKLVSAQFQILYRMTGDQRFKNYSAKFESYLKWPNILKMYKQKIISLNKLNRI